ncbi:flavodoxin family protein [Desulfoluna spongiiphila]|uniref:Flavodoxin domain-containing protein n=1 Tax=Desulfoluna spongiiphila TaxID=419481 RepID=A0A1G5AJI2_9BACT|nr:flavodoxin domain-containing protein [Desulfoluna spongiiphila]SCX77990.1 Flavodoxin domain-containing protein [Desulfoluna spongiiphila]
MRKTLLVFYSRSGTTKALAEKIRARLGCDVDMEEVIDLKGRDGFFGNLTGGIDALFQRQTDIGSSTHDASGYDRIIIGTPVWYGNLAPAIRTWITQNATHINGSAMGFFCTFAGKGDARAGKKFQGVAKPMAPAFLSVQNGEKDEITLGKVAAFAESLT